MTSCFTKICATNKNDTHGSCFPIYISLWTRPTKEECRMHGPMTFTSFLHKLCDCLIKVNHSFKVSFFEFHSLHKLWLVRKLPAAIHMVNCCIKWSLKQSSNKLTQVHHQGLKLSLFFLEMFPTCRDIMCTGFSYLGHLKLCNHLCHKIQSPCSWNFGGILMLVGAITKDIICINHTLVGGSNPSALSLASWYSETSHSQECCPCQPCDPDVHFHSIWHAEDVVLKTGHL